MYGTVPTPTQPIPSIHLGVKCHGVLFSCWRRRRRIQLGIHQCVRYRDTTLVTTLLSGGGGAGKCVWPN